jgi:hypothetical protein
VTNEDKTSLKAACLQAATTLIAARDSMKGAVDVDECVKLAAELYCRLTVMNWEPTRARHMSPLTATAPDLAPRGTDRKSGISPATSHRN